MRHNGRHKLRGHLFQGRYQAVLVEGVDDTYFQTVSDYIHLSPIRARLIEAKQMLVDYGWSSFPEMVGDPRKRPAWLSVEWALGGRGRKDNARVRRAYGASMETRAAEELHGGAMERGVLQALRRGWCFGSEEFRQPKLERVAVAVRRPAGPILAAHNEEQSVRLIARGLKAVGLAAGDLQAAAKGDPRQIAIAAGVKRRTIMQNEWISRRLEMGAAARVSRSCSDAEDHAEVRRLMRKIEMAIGKH